LNFTPDFEKKERRGKISKTIVLDSRGVPMSLDFQQVRQQVKELGEKARQREQALRDLRHLACDLLSNHAQEIDFLRQKVEQARVYDPGLRCALPIHDALNAHFPLPVLPALATVVAVDGSQIYPDRHAEVHYGMVNVGAIQMRASVSDAPQTSVHCELIYGDELYTDSGTITEEALNLQRDLKERAVLVNLAAQAPSPVITFTDGPLELWGAKGGGDEGASDYQQSLDQYLDALGQLYELNAITAGYVDKPGADLVVRLLEVAIIPHEELNEIKKSHPLRGVTELDIYADLLGPGERSAVFAMQSQSAKFYEGKLALHFFYLNVGRAEHAWLARVEIPAWVAERPEMLDTLHVTLVNQCRIMGGRPYPYLLHRAHETARVTLEEKEQVTQMIIMELRGRGVFTGEKSPKQGSKELSGRTSYSG
jgi:hypothetical protein